MGSDLSRRRADRRGLGFGGVAGASIGIAKFLFFIAIALFVIFLILGIVAGKKVV